MNFAQVKSVAIPEGAVVRILSGDVVLWKRSALPSAYQQVDYIQTDGKQYIDTGVLASDYPNGISYVWRGNITSYQTSAINHYLFGCLNDGKRSGNIAFNDNISGLPLVIYLGGNGDNQYNSSLNSVLYQDIEVAATLKSSSLPDALPTVNNTDFSRVSAATFVSTAMPAANIYLLWCNGVGSTSVPLRAKFYGFTMDTADGTPIRNFVPCYRKADNAIGLYDTVEGVFYTNAGTGSFAAGADV